MREAAELLDVDVDQLAGLRAFVVLHWRGRFEIADVVQAVPTQHSADSGRRDGQITGDLLTAQALPTQGQNGVLRLAGIGRCRR